MNAIFLVLFLIPAIVLAWRIVVTKSRSWPRKIGAAAAVMATIVGALVVYDDLYSFEFKDWRADLSLLAAVSASIYLLAWSRKHRGNKRHKTVSIIAAIIGLVPFVATIATALLLKQAP